MSICQLKNSSEADNKLVKNVMLIIGTLGRNNPITFFELYKLANETNYTLQHLEEIKTTLYDYRLVDGNNALNPSVRDIILSAVSQTDAGLVIDNPIIELSGDET